MAKRAGRKSKAQTPAPRKERIYGSKKNPKGSAASEKSASKIKLDDKTMTALKNKLKEFKEKHPNKKNITLNDLKAVYRRGAGAYSKSHRPTITGGAPNTRNAWSMARVNKFLKKAGGAKVKAAYVQDDDLMKMERGGTTLLAPNGKPSNLNPKQYNLVRTPQFKAWFGDWENDPENASKVVDENGEPLVVYHGSDNVFNKFKSNRQIYFSTSKDYAIEHTDTYKDSNARAFFLNVRNLLDATKFYVDDYTHKTYKTFLKKSGIDVDIKDENYISKFWYLIADDSNIGKKISKEYDGFSMYENMFGEQGEVEEGELITKVYCLFNPNQIKLADGTNTTFDGSNPDIRYAKGGVAPIVNDIEPENFAPIFYEKDVVESPDITDLNLTLKKLKLPIKAKEKIGGGSHGDAYLTNRNTILKVTNSGTEAMNSFLVMKNYENLSGQVRVYNVFIITDGYSKIYLIEKDKVEVAGDVLFNFPKDKFYDLWNLGKDNDDKEIIKEEFDSLLKAWEYENNQRATKKEIKYAKDIIDLADRAAWDEMYYDIDISDVIPNNVGFINDDLYCFDCSDGDISFAKGGQTFNDKELLAKWKRGESIGFTATAHLKAKGLISRSDGTKRKSPQYKKQGGLIGGFEDLTDEWLSKKIEIFLEKVRPIKFYFVDPKTNTLTVGFDKYYSLDAAQKVYKEATSSKEFFHAPSVESTYYPNTGDTVFKIKLKKKVEYNEGGEVGKYPDYWEQDIRDDSLVDLILHDEKYALNLSDRYILSHQKEIEFRNKEQDNERIKPKGLWYAFNYQWAYWVFHEIPKMSRDYDYVHKIEVTDKVLRLDTIEKCLEFTKRYGIDKGLGYRKTHYEIDWIKVAKDYSGIEVTEPYKWSRIHRHEDALEWLYGWDVGSGCIWNENGIESIELVHSYARGGKVDDGSENYGQPTNNYTNTSFIHETSKENANSILKNGFKVSNNPRITRGIYTIPLPWKREKFDSRQNSIELELKLKDGSKIFWTNSERPMNYYYGYGNNFYEKLYKKLNKGKLSLRRDDSDENRRAFNLRMEIWLQENGYDGIQQGGEIVITNPKAIKSVKKFNRKENGGEVDDDSYYEDDYDDEPHPSSIVYQIFHEKIKLDKHGRYILSNEQKINFQNVEQTNKIDSKPRGLWYALGSAWADWVYYGMPKRANEYSFLHKIQVSDKILRLDTKEKCLQFTEQFGKHEQTTTPKIDWSEVAKKYSGIEVTDPRDWSFGKNSSSDLFWLYSWDVPSGCVWNIDGIENIELVERRDFRYYQSLNEDVTKSFAKGGEVDEKVIRERWAKKKDSLMNMADNIRSLRTNLRKDLKGDDDKDRLTALAISLMDKTAERVGNSESESNGHLGITGLSKRNVKVEGNTITLKYIGKSGVKHEKQFSDEGIASALKDAIANSQSKYVFETSDGFRIKNDRINRYLSEYDISAKDLRGYSANQWIVSKLREVKDKEILSDEAKRKKKFNEIVKSVAEKVGHGAPTLKKHYMLPSLEREWVNHGKIVDLSNIKRTFEDGGIMEYARGGSPRIRLSEANEIKEYIKRQHEQGKSASWGGDRGRWQYVARPDGVLLSHDSHTNKYKFFNDIDSFIRALYRLQNRGYKKGGDVGVGDINQGIGVVNNVDYDPLDENQDIPNDGEGVFSKGGEIDLGEAKRLYSIAYGGYDGERLSQSQKRSQSMKSHHAQLKLKKLIGFDIGDLPSHTHEQKKIREQILNRGEMKKGGDLKFNDVQIYHEEKGNWFVPKNTVYAWLYSDPNANEKLASGEYEFVLFPPSPPMMVAMQRGFVPPLLKIWTKKYQKETKGADKLLGIVKGWYDEKNNKLYILMMTTRKDMRRKGVNSHIIKELREHFKLDKDQIVFDKPTKQGEMFAKSGKYDNGGEVDLFEHYDKLPPKIQAILDKYENDEADYATLESLQGELEQEGYTFDYGLDYEPYGLRKMAKGGEVVEYPKRIVEYFDRENKKWIREPFTIKKGQLIIYNHSDGGDVEAKFLGKSGDKAKIEILHPYSPWTRRVEIRGYVNPAGRTEPDYYLNEVARGTIKTVSINLIEIANDKYYSYWQKPISRWLKSPEFKEAFSHLDNSTNMAKGGEISDEEKKETYKKWKSLVNMSKSELEKFYNSEEGKVAGLTASQAKSQGISSGRESARWIMKMKDTSVKNWTPTMWKWAKKQISFISRMSGNKGKLYDESGAKTRKHTSLLIWGHNPKKKAGGGELDIPIKENNMNEVTYDQLPAINDLGIGKKFVLKEHYYKNQNGKPTHQGCRYLIVENLGDAQMSDCLKLKVHHCYGGGGVTTMGIITRPIKNIMNKGRDIGESLTNGVEKAFKKGGELDPDKKEVKEYFEHKSGSAGGLLVGKRHSEGGIQAINKSTGQPLEMEGGEVVITRDAVSDSTLHDFNGKQMTNREILSAINESGGGVKFADGGDVSCKCSGKEYKLGGKTYKDYELFKKINNSYGSKAAIEKGMKVEDKEHGETFRMLKNGEITYEQFLKKLVVDHLSENPKYYDN